MSSNKRLQRILQRIYDEARVAMSGLMDTRNMYIALYDISDKSIEFPVWYENGEIIPDEEKMPGHRAGPRRFGGRLLGSYTTPKNEDVFTQNPLPDGLRKELERIGIGKEVRVMTLEEDLHYLIVAKGQDGAEKAYTVVKQNDRLNIYERFGLTDWVILHKKPLLIESSFNEEIKRWGIEAFAIGTQCWLGAPMILYGEVIGVIGLQNFDRARVFDTNHRELLLTIASQTAVAIQNGRLGDKQREERIGRSRKITGRIAEVVSDPDSVLELVVRAAEETTQSDLSSVFLYDENIGSFTGGVRFERDGSPFKIEDKDLPKSNDTEVMAIADKQKPIYEPNANTDFTTRHGIRAYAGIPLIVSDFQGLANTVGVLFVNFREDHTFKAEEKEILEHLANQAAIAIAYTEARTSAEANEQLAALGSAAATLQHRLGNTISITLPAVLRLRYRIGDDPVAEEILDTIERNTLFANEVIRRMQTPLQPEPFVPTNINSLLNTAIIHCVENGERFPQAQLASNLPTSQKNRTSDLEASPQIYVEARLAEDVPETYASVGRLQEVFRVLIENAIKAIYPHAGLVIVECKLRSGGRRKVMEITVTDNGKGIDDKIKSKLFRQPVPRKEFGEGAGLGLWISNIVVRSHKGSIDLQQTKVGEGSTFIVRLPVLDRPPTTTQPKEADL